MSKASFASLCFLSYKRPAFIADAITSAVENAGYPCEVIVHDDGSVEAGVREVLMNLLDNGWISHLMFNPPGHNEGVGTAINRMFKVASGDVLIKLDQDLTFVDGWLARAVGILEQDKNIGMLGLFKYEHDPVDWRKMRIDVPTQGGYHYTRQLCGSAMAIPRRVWEILGPMDEHLDAFNEDSNYMERVRTTDFSPPGSIASGQRELALPDVDLVRNHGFGVGPSTVVPAVGQVATIHHGPRLANEKTCAPQNEVISPPCGRDWCAPHGPCDCRDDELQAKQDALLLSTPENAVISPLDDVPDGVWDVAPHDFRVGIVITTCAGRETNLKRALEYVGDLKGVRPEIVGVIYDGYEVEGDARGFTVDIPIVRQKIAKHGPGQPQPRNVGFDLVRSFLPELTHVWFLDSDLIVPSDTLEHFYHGLCASEQDRVLIGPYDWLPAGVIGFVPEMRDWQPGHPTPNGMADYRWPSFKDYGPEIVHQGGVPIEADSLHDDPVAVMNGRCMGAGLACFGGNLVYPVSEFERVGGFHQDLHHGRCEDGELGLRAVEHSVPMSFVPNARGWHVHHQVNGARAMQLNARDVPLLNSMHPWAQNLGLIVVDKDGKRFDWKCPNCDGIFNSLSYWSHAQTHRR